MAPEAVVDEGSRERKRWTRAREGVVVEDAASFYGAGRRGKARRKVKPGRTYDLVVLEIALDGVQSPPDREATLDAAQPSGPL